MNSKSNQQFNSFDLVSMFFLIAVVLGISTTIVSREMRDLDKSMGQTEAENLAFQLINGGFLTTSADKRSPSAVNETNEAGKQDLGVFDYSGEIGRDPWGQAYRYKVMQDSQGVPSHVLVWSLGPNKLAETKDEIFAAENAENISQLNFSGDDFGYIRPLVRQ